LDSSHTHLLYPHDDDDDDNLLYDSVVYACIGVTKYGLTLPLAFQYTLLVNNLEGEYFENIFSSVKKERKKKNAFLPQTVSHSCVDDEHAAK
jgi:hypothetical protein